MRLFNRCLFYWVFIVQSKTGHFILCFYLLMFWFLKKTSCHMDYLFVLGVYTASSFFFFALKGFLILHRIVKPLFLDV